MSCLITPLSQVADELAELLGEEISKLAAADPNTENTAVLQQLIPKQMTAVLQQ